jgi:MFS family permease
LPEQLKPAPGLGSGALPSVLASVFALDLITALIVVGFGNAYLVRVLHSPPAYPAFALAVYGTVKLLSAPFAGWLVDRARGGLIAALVVCLEAGAILLMLFTGTSEGYIIGVAPLSAGTVLGWLLVLRRLGETLEPGGRGPASSYIALAGSAGLAGGLGLAALLAEHPQPRMAFVAGLVVALASVFALGRLGSVHSSAGRSGSAWYEAPTRRELAAALVLFAHLGTIGSVAVTFGPFALDELGQTLLRLGLLLSPAAAAGILGMVVAGRRSKHGGRLREAAPLYAVAAAAALFCASTSDVRWFAVGAIPLGAAIGAVGPVVNAARIDVASTAQAPGAVLARMSIAEGLGEASVPFLAGLAITAGGERAGMVAVGAALAVIAVLTAVAARTARL